MHVSSRASTVRAADVRGSVRGVTVSWVGLGAGCVGRSVELGAMDTIEFSADGVFAGAALVLRTSAGATIGTVRAAGRMVLFAPPPNVHPEVIGGSADTTVTCRVVATPRRR